MIALTWRYRWDCIRVLALQFALLGMGLAGLALMGLAIDVIRQHSAEKAVGIAWPMGLRFLATWPPLAIVTFLAGAVLLLALVRTLLNYRHAVVVAILVQEKVVPDLRAAVYDKLQRLSFRFFSANTSGSIISRVTSDVQSVRVFVDGVLLQMGVLLVSLAFYLAYMLTLHVGLTLACLATTPVLWYISARFSQAVWPAYGRHRELVDRLLLVLTENVRGVQVVKGFALEQAQIGRFQTVNANVREQQHWTFWRISLFTPSVEFLQNLNMAVLLAYGGYLVIHDQLALGSGLIVFSGLLQQFSGQVTKVTGIVNSIQQSLAGSRRVFEILDQPIEVQNPANPAKVDFRQAEVEFDHLWFEYTLGEPVLSDLCLNVKPGERVAILGATGAGKTSLLNLIPRFYDASGGRLLINGQDVRDLDLDQLRRNIGIVFQETFIFSDTVAANIAFGHPDASREQIERAARLAAAHEFIEELPHGYDTVLREAGKDLSGGQRQRLAIARALLLEPSILLMDDPTAAIDPGTEQEILQALDRAMAGRTTFMVTHRLSSLRSADVIVVLDRGRIVEIGSHDELMLAGGFYWQAVRMQSGHDETELSVIGWREAASRRV